MLNFSHTDLTDLTDFRLLRSFSIETKWEYPLLATKKNPWDPWDPCGKPRRKRAGWASIRSGRWFDNVEWWTHSWCALGLLRTASCRCAFSCFRCQEARLTTSLHSRLLWFRYRPGRCCHHLWFRYRPGWCCLHQWYPSRYPGWYPWWCHPLTEQRPSSA